MIQSNRIAFAIAERRKKIEGYHDLISDFADALDLDLGEYFLFAQLNKLAASQGLLTSEEGETINNFLGKDVSEFNGRDIVVKSVMINVFDDLLRRDIPKELQNPKVLRQQVPE